ncbi:MAG: ABC transporter substrate-binding protein [Deltaproteobacteria bacterium]|nr:ABC transporter substrate-binding protein [Deltaproteobacteria bacterium]
MKMTHLRVLVLVVCTVFLMVGNGIAEEGVTDTEIHIGQWGPQTGPAAAWGSVARGSDAFFKMINDDGGIHGRKIVYHMFVDGYNPAKTKAVVKELQEGVGIFAWASGVGTATVMAVRNYLMEKKIPWVGAASGSHFWITPPQKYQFATYPLYYNEAMALVRYAIEKLGSKKIAMAYQNDGYGKNGLEGAEKELSRHGLKLVAKVPVEVKDTDMKSHVMKMKTAGADTVLLWVSPSHGLRIMGTAQAMKFMPQWMSTSTLSDFPLMFKISKGLWKGVITGSFVEVPESTSPLMVKYKKAFDSYAAKDERWGVFYYAGFGFIEPMVEALKRSGRDLTRERFVKEMEGIRNFQGISGKINFKPFDPSDPKSRLGANQIFLVKCLDGGKTQKLTDWAEYK